MTVDATPTGKGTYPLSWEDGTTKAGFVAILGNGKADPRAIRQFDYQRSGQQTQTGPDKYGDETPPYSTQAQGDWTGGRRVLNQPGHPKRTRGGSRRYRHDRFIVCDRVRIRISHGPDWEYGLLGG